MSDARARVFIRKYEESLLPQAANIAITRNIAEPHVFLDRFAQFSALVNKHLLSENLEDPELASIIYWQLFKKALEQKSIRLQSEVSEYLVNLEHCLEALKESNDFRQDPRYQYADPQQVLDYCAAVLLSLKGLLDAANINRVEANLPNPALQKKLQKKLLTYLAKPFTSLNFVIHHWTSLNILATNLPFPNSKTRDLTPFLTALHQLVSEVERHCLAEGIQDSSVISDIYQLIFKKILSSTTKQSSTVDPSFLFALRDSLVDLSSYDFSKDAQFAKVENYDEVIQYVSIFLAPLTAILDASIDLNIGQQAEQKEKSKRIDKQLFAHLIVVFNEPKVILLAEIAEKIASYTTLLEKLTSKKSNKAMAATFLLAKLKGIAETIKLKDLAFEHRLKAVEDIHPAFEKTLKILLEDEGFSLKKGIKGAAQAFFFGKLSIKDLLNDYQNKDAAFIELRLKKLHALATDSNEPKL